MEKCDDLAVQIGQACLQHKISLVTAESCTGGGLGYALTAVPGSSQWFEGGLITYSNTAKVNLLGVSVQILESEGAVSRGTVLAMAQGALLRTDASLSIAISGIAGPDGGTAEKPVGTVWIAWVQRAPSAAWAQRFLWVGDRAQIRTHAIEAALAGILRIAEGGVP